MRIVTLTAAATEIAFAIGLARRIVGISHDSDWPPEAASRAVVTHSGGDSAGSVAIDLEAVVELRPDLVIASVDGAPSTADERRLRDGLGPEAGLLTLAPSSVEGILNAISTVGAMTGTEAGSLRLIERLRGRLGGIERRVRRRRDQGRRPVRVVALEGLAPPVAAGRWVPEQIRRAGGWELLGREGESRAATTWQAVLDLDPETIVLMPAGRHLDAVVDGWAETGRPPGWDAMEAVRRGQVFAVDAASFFSRPGPRFVEGIALLAEILDPDGFVETSPIGSWTPVD